MFNAKVTRTLKKHTEHYITGSWRAIKPVSL